MQHRYSALLAEVSAIRQSIEQCIPTQLDLSALKSINKKLKKCALWRKADAATTDSTATNADGSTNDGAKKKRKRKRDATDATDATVSSSSTAAAGNDSSAAAVTGGASVSSAIDEIVAVGAA
jgi:hypothetical protein